MTLKEMRIESGLKAKKVAEVLNISRRQLIYLEKKKYKLSDDKIEKLSKLYNKKKIRNKKGSKTMSEEEIEFLKLIKKVL